MSRSANILESLVPELEQLANELGIKASIWDSVQTLYLPLAEWIAQQVSERRAQGTGGAFVVGLNGAPGSGKSTCDAFIQLILERHFELRVSGFSIDDVYLTKREREKLARSVHPLFKVRGVPGTHDVDLALQVLEQLAQADPAEAISIPVFEKVADDRAARVDWREVNGPFDVVVFEGWCVGVRAQSETDLKEPVNELEASEDSIAAWRRAVNRAIETDYGALFRRLDATIFLKVPSMDVVFAQRLEQEQTQAQRLAELQASGADTSDMQLMNESEVRRFMMHYERLIRWMTRDLPQYADIVVDLDEQRRVQQLHFASGTGSR